MGQTGRPTKWKPELNERIVEFFNRPPYKEIDIPHYKKGEIDWIDKKRVPNDLPWMHRFEMQEGLSDGKCARWVDDPQSDEKYPGFRIAYNQAKKLYKEFLVSNALNGLYPPATFIFTAKNTTDWVDTQNIEQKNKTTVQIENAKELAGMLSENIKKQYD